MGLFRVFLFPRRLFLVFVVVGVVAVDVVIVVCFFLCISSACVVYRSRALARRFAVRSQAWLALRASRVSDGLLQQDLNVSFVIQA